MHCIRLSRSISAAAASTTVTAYWVHMSQQGVIWQKAPHGGRIPRLGVTPGGRKLTIEFLG